MAVKGAKRPVQARDRKSRTKARADCVFPDAAGEVSRPHAGRKRHPGKWLELVVDEKCGEPPDAISESMKGDFAAAGQLKRIPESWSSF